HPEPQLIAQAVVAFRHNNLRREPLHQDPLAHTIFPGITMIGTAPTLFRVHITTQLADAIRYGRF
ncbi:hypothetical protein BGY98DRAFT_908554, partial [Russula aff. rugulosa BPL654]